MDSGRQAELEKRIREFIDNINKNNSDTMCGLIKPSFVSFDEEKNSLVMAYPAQYWEQNPIGRMQGGIIAGILDFTAGCLSAGLKNSMPLTVSMQISYLRPGPLEGRLLARATATKTGRTLVFSSVECWEEARPGKLIATASCVYTD